MCDKVILENGGMLKFIPDGYKNQTMCYNLLLIGLMHSNLSSVATCPTYPIKRYLSFCNTISSWDMCDKAVDTCLFVFDSVPDRYKTQKMCVKVVSQEPF